MPGNLLLDDWQKSVEDQLRGAADAAQQVIARPIQVLQDAPRQAQQDVGQVMQSLQQTADSALGGLQVIGGAQQMPNAQDVTAQLQQTATQALGGLIPLQQPAPPPLP